MIATLNIVDGIFEDPEQIRAFALSHSWEQAPDFDGNSYPGFVEPKDPRFLPFLAQQIGAALGLTIRVNKAAFVMGTEKFSTQQWIHADNNCGNFAGVVYLFDRLGFGTQFYRHTDSGAHGLAEYLKANPGAGAGDVAGTLQAHGKMQSPWDRTDYAESRFNRFIMYPTDRFHSRWPEKAFGDKPDNCRLTISIFFDIVE
jgi:hypothetical protein